MLLRPDVNRGNGVCHAAGMLSAVTAKSYPSWAGAHNHNEKKTNSTDWFAAGLSTRFPVLIQRTRASDRFRQ